MRVLLCVFTAWVLGEGVEMSSWLDGHSFILFERSEFVLVDFLKKPFVFLNKLKHVYFFNGYGKTIPKFFFFLFSFSTLLLPPHEHLHDQNSYLPTKVGLVFYLVSCNANSS